MSGLNINKTRISVVTKPTNVSISTAGIQGRAGETQNLSLLNGFTASYFEDSASFAERIDAATNEQDLSNYALLSGSNNFIGVQNIIGAVTTTGSLFVSGSTVQIGNNTLIGRTELSGSISISGSTEFGGDLVPLYPQGATLGTLERPFRDIFLQSASINIAPDAIGGRNARISNTDGNVSIQAAGFQLKSGSFISFEISEDARTKIRVPNIPAGDIGAFSIIGNASGAYQPVINPSGMVHVTGNDGQAARVTVDGFGSSIGAISGLGYSTSSYFPIVGGVPTSLEFQATENYSTSGAGSRAAFYTYANGAVNRTLSAIVDTDGLVLPNVPTNETADKVLVWDSVTGRIGKQSGISTIDGGAAASIFILSTEVLNGGGA